MDKYKSIKIGFKNVSDEENLLKSLSIRGGNSLCEGGLSFIYLYLRGGVKMSRGEG